MDMFVVQGGMRLIGSLAVSGSKNASLPIMAASLAVDGAVTLFGVPQLTDVRTLNALLEQLGCLVQSLPNGGLQIESRISERVVADYDLVRTMRASVCVLGPLLARRGRARVSLPGGCNIGYRPIDLHLKGLAALGADLRVERGYVVAESHGLRGATVDLTGPCGSTVTGTCNVLSAAALAQGTTVIQGAAREPEVAALADFLNACGAKITGQGTSQIVVDGVDQLSGTACRMIPDRIEAATLLIAAAMTQGDITLSNVQPGHLRAVLEVLWQVGCQLTVSDEGVRLRAPERLQAAQVIAQPYPGVPTDVQAQLTSLLCLAEGTSLVRDEVFPDRFQHIPELARLGAQLQRSGNSVRIEGIRQLSGANVMASDLRASAALVLAALVASDESIVRRIYHLDRGYEQLELKLSQLGAHVRRVKDIPANVPWPLRRSA